MIKHVSLAHGWYYHYRIHTKKTNLLCNEFVFLKDYLEEAFENCPEEPFTKGPRSSSLKFSLPIQLKEVYDHEVSKLCKEGLSNMHNYKTAHSKVQMFMLEFDKNSISVETPIWLLNKELKNFEKIFQSDESLSGHIDVLRIEKDKKIWIWDYKPNAEMEKYASTQVFFYALMMSQRTSLPLENFRCGYFDENVAYIFKPELEVLKEI